MFSLGIFAASLVVPFVVTAWALAFAARRLGSSRGRFRVGLLAALTILVLNLAFAAVGSLAPANRFVPQPLHVVLLLAGQLIAVFFVLAWLFRLSPARTAGPFAVYAASAAVQIAAPALVVRPYLVEWFVVPTGSMVPTIEPGDHIAVVKPIAPRRGDVVAYWTADRPPAIYCHRLVGLPGERLRFSNGAIFVDDKELTPPTTVAGRYRAAPAGAEEYNLYRDGETIALGADEYFFLGDNVDRANDSRLQGPSVAGDVVGVIDLTYWPLGRFHVFR